MQYISWEVSKRFSPFYESTLNQVSMLQVHASLSMFMLHVSVHVAYHALAACPYPCCMSVSMLHVRDHAACPCPCCMSVSMLHVRVHAASPSTCSPCCVSKPMVNVQAHGTCPSPCCMSKSMLHVQLHGAYPGLYYKSMSI
jgi:hypothetical protein